MTVCPFANQRTGVIRFNKPSLPSRLVWPFKNKHFNRFFLVYFSRIFITRIRSFTQLPNTLLKKKHIQKTAGSLRVRSAFFHRLVPPFVLFPSAEFSRHSGRACSDGRFVSFVVFRLFSHWTLSNRCTRAFARPSDPLSSAFSALQPEVMVFWSGQAIMSSLWGSITGLVSGFFSLEAPLCAMETKRLTAKLTFAENLTWNMRVSQNSNRRVDVKVSFIFDFRSWFWPNYI